MLSKRTMWFGASAVGVLLLLVAGLSGVNDRAPSPSDLSPKDQVLNFFHYVRMTVPSLREQFPKEHIRLLHDLLKDKQFSYDWGTYAQALAFLEEPEAAYDALYAYIVRKEANMDFRTINGKLSAIQALGFIDSPRAQEILRYAFSSQGADELSKRWGTPEKLRRIVFNDHRTEIQNKAALGLVFSNRPENFALVESEYRRLLPQVTSVAGKYADPSGSGSTVPFDDRQLLRRFDGLATALGDRDQMIEMGREKFLNEAYYDYRLGMQGFAYGEKYRIY